MEVFHGTTIVSAAAWPKVAMGGDGQVTLGNIIVKQGAKKFRRLHHDRILAGLHGAPPCVHLFERFDAKLDKASGGQPDALCGRTREGLAHRSHPASPGGNVARRRWRNVAGSLPARVTCSNQSWSDLDRLGGPYAHAAARGVARQ